MLEDGRANIIPGVDVDAAIELNESACSGPIMAPGLVECFPDEMESHFELSRT